MIASVTNSPCVTIPIGEIGLEIIGRSGDDSRVLAIANTLDRILNC